MTALSTQKQEPYIPLMERVHQGTVKRFSSELDMKASYSGSRKRCFKSPKARKLPLRGTRPPRFETIDIYQVNKDLAAEVTRLKAELEEQRKEALRLERLANWPVIKDIVAQTAKEYDVPASAIMGRSKATLILNARRVAMVRAWRALKDRMSMSEIARRFNRDHSTLRWNLIIGGAFEPSEQDMKNLPKSWGGYHG